MTALKSKRSPIVKDEVPIIIFLQDQIYLNSFLEEKRKSSYHSYHTHKTALKDFFVNIDKNLKEINMIDVRNYLSNVLDKKNIQLRTKEQRRAILTTFFSYFQGMLLSKDKLYQNPVPNKNVFQFTQKETDIKKYSDESNKILSLDQIEQILDFCKKNRYQRDFIYIGLLVCTGARESEIRTIRLKDINLKECYFETGFIKGARKSTLKSKRTLLFFFPKRFKICLQNYILSLKSLNENEEWLFPGRKNNHLSESYPNTLKTFLLKKLGFYFSYHFFRRTLITLYHKNGTSLLESEMLMNHKSNSTQGNFYIKLSISEKREIYKKYFPYDSIEYFS